MKVVVTVVAFVADTVVIVPAYPVTSTAVVILVACVTSDLIGFNTVATSGENDNELVPTTSAPAALVQKKTLLAFTVPSVT